MIIPGRKIKIEPKSKYWGLVIWILIKQRLNSTINNSSHFKFNSLNKFLKIIRIN